MLHSKHLGSIKMPIDSTHGIYRGENPGPGKDVHGELDHRPGIREQPRSKAPFRVRIRRVRYCSHGYRIAALRQHTVRPAKSRKLTKRARSGDDNGISSRAQDEITATIAERISAEVKAGNCACEV